MFSSSFLKIVLASALGTVIATMAYDKFLKK